MTRVQAVSGGHDMTANEAESIARHVLAGAKVWPSFEAAAAKLKMTEEDLVNHWKIGLLAGDYMVSLVRYPNQLDAEIGTPTRPEFPA